MTPLAKRLPRELKHNLGKYLGIFLLMLACIAATSGFLLAAHSIQVIMDGMRDAYAIEDGRFTTAFEATAAQLDAARDAADDHGGMDTYENFSIDAALSVPGQDNSAKRTVRAYTHRTSIDIAAYCEGAAPGTADEVAIDRVFAQNNGLAVGDAIELEGRAYTICGILTLPDMQALFSDNSAFTVNTLGFGVAEMTQAGFDALADEGGAVAYNYSFAFHDRGLTVADRTQAEKDVAAALAANGAQVTDLLDADSNQGITYAANDMEGDSAMWETLLYIIVVIMAFIFVVLTSGTIEEESAVIGTMLASGYRRRELVTHYLALPVVIGLVAAVAGGVLGVTVFTEPMRSLYYNSYSLPPFHVSWDWSVFVKTTVVPVAVLFVVTFLGLLRKMGKTPLQFLRHEASGKKGTRRGVKLPERLGFVARFRLRVFLRNLGNFATLFMGIGFASMLLLFGLCVLPTMQNYASGLKESLPAEHLYTLKAPLELADAKGAEKFAAYSLQLDRGEGNGEETVTFYGVSPDSAYWDDLDVSGDGAVFGAGLVDKFGFGAGQEVSFYDKYNDKTYRVTYEGEGHTWGSATTMNVYLSLAAFNDLFGKDADYFNGYASNNALDIDPAYLASEVTPDDMQAMGDQFINIMGSMTGLMVGLSVFIYLIFMYLLTKAVIDRSSRSISYMKVFGYRDGEISQLYIRSMTICVAVSLVASLPVVMLILSVVFRSMLARFSGNIELFAPTECVVQTVLIGFATYLAVAVAHLWTIKRVSLAEALKVQE